MWRGTRLFLHDCGTPMNTKKEGCCEYTSLGLLCASLAPLCDVGCALNYPLFPPQPGHNGFAGDIYAAPGTFQNFPDTERLITLSSLLSQ